MTPIRFYVYADTLGGEPLFFSRIARHFATRPDFLWDVHGARPALNHGGLIWGWAAWMFKALHSRRAKDAIRLVMTYILVATIHLPDEIAIVSSSFVPIPMGKKVVAYIHTTPRFATVDYADFLAKFRRNSFWKGIAFRVFAFTCSAVYRNSLRNAKLVICNSAEVRDRLQYFYHTDSIVVHPSIPTADFRTGSPGRYFLCVSRLSREKGQDIAVRAFEEFCSIREDFELVLAGELPTDGAGRKDSLFFDELEAYATSHGLPVRFKMSVSRDELLDLYANAYACVFASRKEDFGFVPIEAMASAKPVIALNVGGPKETVIDGETGLLVSDARTLAAGMLRLANDPQEVRKMGERGRKHVVENFSDQAFIDKMKQFLKTVG